MTWFADTISIEHGVGHVSMHAAYVLVAYAWTCISGGRMEVKEH